ncbi:MAG: hypothetical protein PHH04_05500 [Thomasclavelia sp.]|nr:hypothetical protein [Thomasclavelia sp.]
MLNQLKMHLNTLVRRKYVYVIGVVFFIIPIISSFFAQMMMDVSKKSFVSSLNVETLESMFGSDIASSTLGVIVGIMAAIYFTRMISTGFIKNIASTVKNRSVIGFSIVIAFTLISCIYILVSMGGTLFAYKFIYNADIPIGTLSALPLYFLYNLLFVIGSIIFAVTIAVVTKSNNIAILTIVVVNFFSNEILSMVSRFLPFDVLDYSMWHAYGQAGINFSSQWITGGLSALIVIVVGSIVSYYFLNKKDLI